LSELGPRYAALVAGERDGLLAEWRASSATLGRMVRVDLGSTDVEGKAVDVTAEGHLVVDTLEGDRRVFAVGDVVHLR
jgi:biotin-(acetyl-CoA carboxylase) ligase